MEECKEKEIRQYAEKVASKKLAQLEEGYNILMERYVDEKSRELSKKAEKIVKPLKGKIDELTKKANKELLGNKLKILSNRECDYETCSEKMVFKPFQINVHLEIRPEMFHSFLRLEYDIDNKKKLEASLEKVKEAKDNLIEALLFGDKAKQKELLEELKKL